MIQYPYWEQGAITHRVVIDASAVDAPQKSTPENVHGLVASDLGVLGPPALLELLSAALPGRPVFGNQDPVLRLRSRGML